MSNGVADDDAAENEWTGSIIRTGEKFLATVIRIARGNVWNRTRGEIREGAWQEIERFDRESEAPETLAREQSADLSGQEKSLPDVTVASYKSVLVYTVACIAACTLAWRIHGAISTRSLRRDCNFVEEKHVPSVPTVPGTNRRPNRASFARRARTARHLPSIRNKREIIGREAAINNKK